MATAPSQNTAGAVYAPTTDPNRNSSASVQTPSESPTLLAPAPTSTGSTVNGNTNGVANPSPASMEGSFTADMRVYPRDGRVRNPVPSKLKNVNESMRGNFSVMHMDVASHRASEGRDAAAKRTSESTLMQAKMAQTNQYVSHQRRANYPRPPGLKQFNRTPRRSRSIKAPVEPQVPVVTRPLTISETKGEQARLLTLLRTLPHHTVVDQICKGLAFFGGIPDAPPPVDGKFPESAEANGSGSLFVGWIAEIFPDPNRPRRTMPAPVDPAEMPKRPRGRPKGSKATKSRSDKGIKKGSQKSGKGAEFPGQDPHDESWVDVDVDVDDTVLELNESGDLTIPRPSTPEAGPSGDGLINATPATGSTSGFRSINDAGSAPGANTKKRGRPKGSKNRPKEKSVSQSGPPPKVTPVPVPVPMLDTQAHVQVPVQNKLSTTTKPKSNKSRPKPAAEPISETSIVSHQQPAEPNEPPAMSSHQTAVGTQSYTDVSDLHGLDGVAAYNQETQMPVQPLVTATQSPAAQVKASTVTAKKRKRPSANAAARVESNPVVTGTSVSQHDAPNGTHLMPSPQIQTQTAHPIPHPTPPQISAPPPAKRARKSQDSSSSAVARRQTPNNANQKPSVPPLPVVAEPVNNQPDLGNMMSPNPPVAEGLEAHYAAMQSHTDSYNNRAQHKQQSISTAAMRSTASPAPATAPPPAEGLDAHYEHFTSLQQQSLPDNPRQNVPNRQQQQQQQQRTTHTASPIPTQPTKPPQMSNSLSSQRQTGSSQGYYAQNQGLGSSSYSSQQPTSYSTNPRGMPSNSPNTALVQHVTNSPQFSNQSNSPLMQTDNGYRSSPSFNAASFGNRRTTSASPLDNGAYRSSTNAGHGVPNHSPHFSTRQTSTTTAPHNSTSHPALSSASFSTFSDPTSFMDINLDSSGGHGSLGIGAAPYGLNSNTVQQQQRTSTSSAAPLYSSAGMNNSFLGNTGLGRTSQNRWAS
ncbi:hypothetical protein F5Y18DRAFT_178767 [Xylariaceae sp. FL1019]|nr:hypothetical protein F5Y18DRAFT_178767 [Xylariaceae sp. FL1019]